MLDKVMLETGITCALYVKWSLGSIITDCYISLNKLHMFGD